MFCSTPISAAKAKFGVVDIAGLPPAQSAELQRSPYHAACAGSRSSNSQGQNLQALHAEHGDQIHSVPLAEGWLSCRAGQAGRRRIPRRHQSRRHSFQRQPGPKTQVQIAGARLWPWTKRSLLPEYQGIGVDEETVQEGQQALISHYQAKGYFDVKVASDMTGDEKLRTVVYHVTKGQETQSHRRSSHRSNRK